MIILKVLKDEDSLDSFFVFLIKKSVLNYFIVKRLFLFSSNRFILLQFLILFYRKSKDE